MNSVITLVSSFLLLCVVAASGAPTGILSAGDMLNNAHAAQALNAQYQNITANDACSSGDKACVSGRLASCVNGAWQTSPCPKTTQCFALPSVRVVNVVNLLCTSERHATSIIQSTGGTGGIAVANASSTNSIDSSNNGSSSNDSNDSTTTVTVTATSTSSSATKDSGKTVTVTVTDNTAIQTAFTTTISPDEASSILFSLTQSIGTTFTISSSLAAVTAASVISPAFAAEPTQMAVSSAVDDKVGVVGSSSSVFKLSAAPVATSSI